MKRMLIGLVIVIALVSGGIGAYRQSLVSPQTAVAQTEGDESLDTVTDRNANIVSAEGQIVPLYQAALSFPVGGQVADILVGEGDVVKAGEPLIRLEATDLEIEVRRAEAALAQAEANLAVAQAQMVSAEAGVTVAEIGVAASEAQLALAQAAPLPEEIAVAESNLAAVSAGINNAVANQDATLEIPSSAIRAAEAQVAAAMAEERFIQEQYDVIIRNGVGGPQEEQTRFALNAAEANLNAAQAALDELTNGHSEAQQRLGSSAVSMAVARRDAAQAQLDLLLANARPEQIAVYEVNVQQAEAAVAQAQTTVSEAEAAVIQAEAGVLQAQAALDTARAALERMTLKVTFDGVVASLSAKIGEVVTPGAPIVTLVNFDEWLVETKDLTELNIVSVAIGDPVNIHVDALPNQTIQGTVTKIASVSTITHGDVTYTVTIRLDNVSQLPLRWGMTAFVDVNVNP